MTRHRHRAAADLLHRPKSLAGTFNQVAADYAARPGYPAAVYDVLVRSCGLRAGTRVLEMGPGVGQATLALAGLGARVVAVEPGADLARLLRERAGAAGVRVVVSSFEDADLTGEYFDLVCAATSFHWVDPAVGIAKAAGLLHDGGWLALWWTIWDDPSRPDAFHDALRPVLERKAPELTSYQYGPEAYRRDLDARAGLIEQQGSFGPVRKEVIGWEGRHDPTALRRLFATFAAWIALPDDLRTDLLDDVERLARDRFGSVVTRPYQTVVYLARRRPRG